MDVDDLAGGAGPPAAFVERLIRDTGSTVQRSAHSARWQERVDAWPAVRAYKQLTYERCATARPVLDVGSGPGVDLVELGEGAIGVDRSTVMNQRTAARGRTVVAADALALPFADGTFGGVRADRTLQHLQAPADALAECARVVRPGGVLVVADPDQGSLVIEVPGAPARLVDVIRRRRRDRQYRSGTYVRHLPAWLRQMGFDEVAVEAPSLVLTDPADAFGIASWGDTAAAEGALTAAEAGQWWSLLGGLPPDQGFVYAVTFFVVSGHKPLR
jgi:SAM-dependent methyltransferase